MFNKYTHGDVPLHKTKLFFYSSKTQSITHFCQNDALLHDNFQIIYPIREHDHKYVTFNILRKSFAKNIKAYSPTQSEGNNCYFYYNDQE